MAEELTRALELRAARGEPRGAMTVLAEARRLALVDTTHTMRWRNGAAFAVAVAVITLVLGGAILLVTRLLVPDTAPTVTVPETPTLPPTTAAQIPGGVLGALDDVSEVAAGPDGRLWVAAAAGVVAWDVDAEAPTVFSEADGLGGRNVWHVTVGADGTVWAAGDAWLARYDGAWATFGEDVLGDDLSPIGDLAAGLGGTVWVAAGDGALVGIDADGATTFPVPEEASLTQPWAQSIAVGPDGTVWASTMMSGIVAFDGEWHHFGAEDGLPSDIVGNVAVAPDGTVWVGGNGLYGDPEGDIPAGGIARFDGTAWTWFTTADGLLSDDGDITVGSDGTVWVVHSSLPEEVAAALGVQLPAGVSRYDGTGWVAYPGVPVGRGAAAVDADGTLWAPSPGGVLGFDGVAARWLVAGPEAVPPLLPPGPPVVLERAEEVEPVRLSTSIGEIEFTAWTLPIEGDPPFQLTVTDHGVIGNLPPEGTPAWSLDGVTWTEIGLSIEPSGWSDQAAGYGDDLFAFVDNGVGRLVWTGSGWTEAQAFTAPPVQRGAVGPHGVVASRADRLYFWDGSGFVEATRPPDPSLHPEARAGCSSPGWQSEGLLPELGPLVATEDGFLVLAPIAGADWHKTPVCQPLVWRSTDGDVWTPTSDASPFGEGAFVRDVAMVGGRIVAVGGTSSTRAAVWVSDDGIAWERVDLPASDLGQVAGGTRGWIALGDEDLWFSPDGLRWDGPYERPPGWYDPWGMGGVAMLDDRIIGAGSFTDRPGGSGTVVIGLFIDG